MRVNKKEAALLQKAIDQWQKDNIIDETTGEKLKHSVSAYRDDFDSLTFYAFVAAISCTILAFGALVLDEKWIERMRRFFEFSELVISLIFIGITIFLVWVLKRRKRKYPYTSLANESFSILIALSAGVAIAYLSKSFVISPYYYGLVIFSGGIIYGVIGRYLNSKILWICMLAAIVGAWGVQTYAWSGDAMKSYFLGMNYPLRMTIFGAAFLLAAYLLKNRLSQYYKETFYFGWIFFLFSAWILSISGNLDYDVWAAIRQGKLFMWAIGFTLLMIALVVYAFKLKDELFRDIVILFFLLNIYTRYFEYFWDRTNKGLFFALLALSFWLIGRKAEQMRRKFME